MTAEKARRLTEDRLRYYRPYPKQKEFHHAKPRERLLMAGNQLGKTLAGGFEAAMHATGRYPDWWEGKRFDKPTVGWCCGVTGEVVRDTVQKVLVGRTGQTGTGAIPKDAIIELIPGRGTPDLLDSIQVQHVSGINSLIGLKSYASGREKFQLGLSICWSIIKSHGGRLWALPRHPLEQPSIDLAERRGRLIILRTVRWPEQGAFSPAFSFPH